MTDLLNEKISQGVSDLQHIDEENAVRAKAKELNMPYINLNNFSLNQDLSNLISKEDAEFSQSVVFFKSVNKLKIAVLELNEKTDKIFSKLKDEGFTIEVSLCSKSSLDNAHKIYNTEQYRKKSVEEDNLINFQDLGSMADEISNLNNLKDKIEHSNSKVALNYIEVAAVKVSASDIHFQAEKEYVLLRFRIDGVLKNIFKINKETYSSILTEIKQSSKIKLNVIVLPQDGQYSFLINNKEINVRVSTLPTHYGESVVMRILNSDKAKVKLNELGFSDSNLRIIEKYINVNHGMLLISGPTGSGKTTTLYSILRNIDIDSKKIITLEDPIEYNLEGISQSQVQEDKNFSFTSGLRAILRQDPDIIMIGEIRDIETAKIAVQSSLTGHLLLSTLHTNSVIESISRLINMGIDISILAPSLNIVIAQRLIRKVCVHCSKDRELFDSEKEDLSNKLSVINNKLPEALDMPNKIKVAVGCDKCSQTGYIGQTVISEILDCNDDIKNMILQNKSVLDIKQYLYKNQKMLSLYEDGLVKVLNGVSTLEELNRVSS